MADPHMVTDDHRLREIQPVPRQSIHHGMGIRCADLDLATDEIDTRCRRMCTEDHFSPRPVSKDPTFYFRVSAELDEVVIPVHLDVTGEMALREKPDDITLTSKSFSLARDSSFVYVLTEMIEPCQHISKGEFLRPCWQVPKKLNVCLSVISYYYNFLLLSDPDLRHQAGGLGSFWPILDPNDSVD
jgi:hypothetical protein